MKYWETYLTRSTADSLSKKKKKEEMLDATFGLVASIKEERVFIRIMKVPDPSKVLKSGGYFDLYHHRVRTVLAFKAREFSCFC